MQTFRGMAVFGTAFVTFLGGFADALETEYVVLVTVDGLRHQELFTGVDPLLMDNAKEAGIDSPDVLREEYWRETPNERREALFPFFWGTLADEGIILGNQERNSKVLVENHGRFSYPGYAEILTGRVIESIKSNAKVRNPETTVLEFVQSELDLPYTGVAAFCSWEVFNWIVSKEENAFPCNAGYELMDPALITDGMKPLNEAQMEMLTPWDSVRFDEVTFTFAMEYLKTYEPKVLYIGLGETDDWAHNGRYDRVVHAANYFDRAMEELWTTLQSMEKYAGKTTLIITTDHGRGDNIITWKSHSSMIPGSEDIWMAVFGPDTPNRGELADTETYTQGQVAATLAKFLGLNFEAVHPSITPPLAAAFAE